MLKIMISIPLLLILFTNLFGQKPDNKIVREYYLTSSVVANKSFGLQVKRKMNNNNYLRFGLTDLEIKQENHIPSASSSYPMHKFKIMGHVKLGLEKRKALNDKSGMYYGINAQTRCIFQRYRIEDPTLVEDLRKTNSFRIDPGISIHAGIIMQLKENLYFSGEIEPEFNYIYSKEESIVDLDQENKFTAYEFNLNTQIIKLSLIYRIENLKQKK